ncbi:hypothetical protein GCM10007973_20060 [Polymorphobacter multimanifer]|uniref:Uncharacterized protein n=1 Tax=Polymorphobacter multimanifer TaxID=1070431 RepID=A0A841LDM8_9SPHN|nr:hypothetical protein [Polymorphobacter multimanifer]MBB6227915.1 hypothetical protein [Polymorphobacter multimanifer]GGI83552.1 hypothetical protein GCM10007973_20060 [Polymorphobacter multimanifer]
MDLNAAQQDMRAAFVRGAPGVLVSGLVWLASGLVWLRAGVDMAFAVLFFGGMAIVPLSLLIARTGFRAPKLAKGNPLERLGLESTFILFAGIFIAYGLLGMLPTAVFPVMAIIIGARYFVFRTVYGEALYWALGAALVAAGVVATVLGPIWPGNLALIVGAIECGFSALIFSRRGRG